MGWKSLQDESVGYICQSLVSCDCPSHIQLDGHILDLHRSLYV